MARVSRQTSSGKILGHSLAMAYMTCAPTGVQLVYRGLSYGQEECISGPFPANLWLTYRGVKYRPAHLALVREHRPNRL